MSQDPSIPHHEASERELADAAVHCAVLTVSDTRTRDTDASGDRICSILEEFGHAIIAREIVPDDPARIRRALDNWLRDQSVHAVLLTGGTGIARRDNTIEVVRTLLSVELEGFGEIFRMISFGEVGSAAMLSRAVGGLVMQPAESGGDTFIFALPGSVNAVETATRRLIAPELRHMVWERRR